MTRVLLLGFLAILTTGCVDTPASDPELADAVALIKEGLDAWKQGAPPSSLESAANPLRFTDDDWKAGAKLLDYRLLKAGNEDEGESLCSVQLKLELRGKPAERGVNYRVTLTPTRTAARVDPAKQNPSGRAARRR